MMNPIAPISGIVSIPIPEFSAKTEKPGNFAFGQILNDANQTVESAQTNASGAVDRFLTGSGGELHTAMLATGRAELEFQLFLQVRNKVMSAYQQIMQVQV